MVIVAVMLYCQVYSASDVILVLICNMFTHFLMPPWSMKLIIGIAGSGLLVALGIYNFFFRKVQTADNGMLVINNLRKRDIGRYFFFRLFYEHT